MNDDVHIGPMSAEDWPAVRAIYAAGIASGEATFETAAPEWAEWDSHHLETPRLVARAGDGLWGWAALSAVSERCIYEGVGEVSLYVARERAGRGVGRALLSALAWESEAQGIWTLQAGIFPENAASLRVHEACGFRVVGVRERLGRLNGRWRDVALVERRSPVAGAD